MINMEVNIKRVLSNLESIGTIGKDGNNGITRLAFSEEYYIALNVLDNKFKELGLESKIDRLGNIFGHRKGTKTLPSIMIGSHLDTVKNGGLYDGLLGIIAAIEVVEILNDNNIETKHPITIVGFNAEEGSELGGTFGSRAIMGLVDLKDYKIKDKLEKYEITVKDVESSLVNIDDIRLFLELHVEQSKKMDREGITIGIVEGIVAIYRYNIIIEGEANHSGTTLMKDRKDSLVEASKIISKLDKIAKRFNDEIVITVGKLDVYPGAVNVIPGKVEFTLEIRDMCEKNICEIVKNIDTELSSNENIEYKIETICEKPSVKLSDDINKIIESKCQLNKFKYCKIISRAGHDAKSLSSKVPTGMVFVPSKDGRSHCPDEYTDSKDIEKGIKILMDTILELDNL